MKNESIKRDAPKMKVKCGVENCSYNVSRMCHADELEVNTVGENKAYSSDGTCCTTFINRDSRAES